MVSVVLSGGSGTRLWPVSRAKMPKQFCDLFVESLFTKTCKRLKVLGEVHVCTSLEMKTMTEKSIREFDLKVTQSLYEPFGRNTAPAIALICQNLKLKNRMNEVIGIFPSDHWIEKPDTFNEVIGLAKKCAESGQIVTIGIQASYPATGFGYIESDQQVYLEEKNQKSYKVQSFKEKPKLELAQEYLKKGNYFWNSGMFIFKCQNMIEAFQTHMPELWKNISLLKEDLSNLDEVYSRLKPESIDYGVMEKAKNIVCIPCDIGWSDLGSWDDIASIKNKKLIKNFANSIEYNSKNCFTFSSFPKTICLNGVNDLIVVDTEDALMISAKGESQEIKKVIDEVVKNEPLKATDHIFENRPWGIYRNLWEEESFKTKVITVDPFQQLSYQSHTKRAETWVIVEGAGIVVLNDESIEVKVGSVVNIPVGAKHRMKNENARPLKFVEVQLGSYFGEDDITRYQDDYRRV